MNLDKARLAIAMARNGINFQALAKLSGISRATLSYINNGKSCKPEVAGKIAAALGVDVMDIIEEVQR